MQETQYKVQGEHYKAQTLNRQYTDFNQAWRAIIRVVKRPKVTLEEAQRSNAQVE